MRCAGRTIDSVVRVMAVVPTFNEVDNLEALVRGLRDVEPGIGIVVVDDGSADGTSELAHRLAAELGDITVIDRPAKLGLGSAYRRGFAQRHRATAPTCACRSTPTCPTTQPTCRPCSPTSATAPTWRSAAATCPGGRIERWPWSRRWLSRWGNRYAAGVLGWRSTTPRPATGRTAAKRCGGWTSTR